MEEETSTSDEVSLSIMLAERVRAAVGEAESFKPEVCEVGKVVDRLASMLRHLARLLGGSKQPPIYDRPIRCVISEVIRNLEKTLTLVKKCKRQSLISRICTITNAADFRKVISLLDSSNGDVKWLLGIYDPSSEVDSFSGGIEISLPPIATNDPILPWVWSLIALIQSGKLPDRIEAANQICSIARDSGRNKKIIVDEGGVPPLLRLLNESSSPEAQIAATTALECLASDQDRVRVIVRELGVPIIVQVLGDSPMRVQIKVSNLVARMVECDDVAQYEFARGHVIRPLVTLLSLDAFMDDLGVGLGKQSIHSIVQINKQVEKSPSEVLESYLPYSYSHLHSSLYRESSSNRTGRYRRERENEKPEVKHQLKINCAKALWMLAKGDVANSRRITETKGLLCLAKWIEKETGELQYNCLMAIMEITAAAECCPVLRRAAFKTNSPAAKAVIDQLLRIIKKVDSPILQIPAIRSIGSLARTFPARETRVINPLVAKFGSDHQEVATEAVITLQKFACPDNFLHVKHSKDIVEFGGISLLLRLIRNSEQQSQLQGLALLCYLALHASNNEGFERAKVLTALEGADRLLVSQHLEFKELVSKAIYQLSLYDDRTHCQRPSFVP